MYVYNVSSQYLYRFIKLDLLKSNADKYFRNTKFTRTTPHVHKTITTITTLLCNDTQPHFRYMGWDTT